MGKKRPQATKNRPVTSIQYPLSEKMTLSEGFGPEPEPGVIRGCIKALARMRQPRRRYPVYWTARSNPCDWMSLLSMMGRTIPSRQRMKRTESVENDPPPTEDPVTAMPIASDLLRRK